MLYTIKLIVRQCCFLIAQNVRIELLHCTSMFFLFSFNWGIYTLKNFLFNFLSSIEGSSLKPEAHEVEVEKFDKFHVDATINSESSLVDEILVDECGLSMLHKNGNSVSHEEV